MQNAVLKFLFVYKKDLLGVPCVIVGDRQKGREHSPNVVFSDYDQESIVTKD